LKRARYGELERIRAGLESEVEGFPRDKCEIAAERVALILGLRMVEGIIKTDEGLQHHVFNYDSQTMAYVDVSADQFRGFEAQKILVTPIKENGIYREVRDHDYQGISAD